MCRNLSVSGWVLAVCLLTTSPVAAEEIVNGYTYVAPSYYLTPPVVVTGPLPPPVVVYPPAPITVYEPAFLHTTVVPYDPVWPYAYMNMPGAYYRERVTVRPRGVDYRVRTYGGAGPVRGVRTEIEYRPYGVEYKVRTR